MSIYHQILGVPAPSSSTVKQEVKELYSFYGFKNGKQVLTIIDVELTKEEAWYMFHDLMTKFNLDDCDYCC